jgi:hypothetical protein
MKCPPGLSPAPQESNTYAVVNQLILSSQTMTKLFVLMAALCVAPVGMSGEVRMTPDNGIVEIGMMNEPLENRGF